MTKKHFKKTSIFLAFIMMLGSIFVSMPNVARAEGEVFVETFENFPGSGSSYVNGSFTGVNGITWTYEGGRADLAGYEIDGKGIMFKDLGKGIYAENIGGGIKEFSVDLKKAYTSTKARAVELFINDTSIDSFTLDNAKEDIQTFTIKDINISGEFKLYIKNTGSAQTVVDNITWTSYDVGGGEEIPLESISITGPETVQERSTIKLGAEYTPEETTQRGVTWESSNETIATVDSSGTVTGIAEGTATITATSTENAEISATYEVTVTPLSKMTISEVRELGEGEIVFTEGIFTADIDTNTMCIQDDQAGITIFKNNISLGDIAVGDKVKVIGKTEVFNSLKQIRLLQDGDIEFIEKSAVPAPELVTISDVNTGNYESQLIEIKNVTLGTINTGGNTSITDEESNSINIFRIPELTDIVAGDKVDIVAIASTFNGPQLRVRSADDVTKVEELPQVEAVTADPAPGEVESGTKVTLSTATADATIYYTIDGTTPTESSTEYTAPIEITEATTIKAVAKKDGMKDSEIAEFAYTVKPVELPQVEAVTATPAPGEVLAGTEVTLSTATEDATIYYSLDETAPTTEYTAPIEITEATTIKAIAKKEGMKDSEIAEFAYTVIKIDTISDARAKAKGSETIVKGLVTGMIGNNAFIQDDTAAIYLYNSSTNIPQLVIGNEVILKGTLDEFNNLKQIKSVQVLKVVSEGNPLPEAIFTTLPLNEELESKVVKVDNLIIKAIPAPTSSSYSIAATDGINDIELRVDKNLNPKITLPLDGIKEGDLVTVTANVGQYFDNYQLMIRTIDDIVVKEKPQVLPVTATPAPGAVIAGKEVVLSTATADATIYYTTDGTEPTEASTKYEEPIIIDKEMTIKAIAVKLGMKDSEVVVFEYTIKAVTRPIEIVEGKVQILEDKATLVLNIANYTKELINATIIVKHENEAGRPIAIEYRAYDIAVNDDGSVVVNFALDKKIGKTIKVYIWDDLDNMKSLSKVKTIEIE